MISIAVHSSIDNLISTSDKVMKLNFEIRSVLDSLNRGIIVVNEENHEVQFENPCYTKLLTGKVSDKILISNSDDCENEEAVSIMECINIEAAQTFRVAGSDRQILIKSVPIHYMDNACRMVEIVELPKTEAPKKQVTSDPEWPQLLQDIKNSQTALNTQLLDL